MEFEESALYRDVSSVINSGTKPVHYTWKATLHYDDVDVEVMKVKERDTLMEFDLKFAEEMMLTIEVGLGTYAHRIYPNREKLEISLTRYPIGEISDAQDDEAPLQIQRYSAVLVERGDIKLEANTPNVPSEETLNLVQMVPVEFQLINKTLEQLRLMAWLGTPLRNTTVEKALKAVLTTASDNLNVDATQRPKGVTMVDASNKQQYEHVIIPHGLTLVDLPAFLQKQYGIYSTGMGYFYHQDQWHVYPKYNTERFGQADSSITVINVPKNRLTGVERTYRQDGAHITVLATSEVKLEDRSAILQLNRGNGVRFADANRFLEGFATTKNNKSVAPRTQNNSEFLTTERSMNNVRFSNNKITANPYVEYSEMAERNGAYFSMRWENSDQSLIVPGMVAKIIYLDGEEVRELYGTLLKVHHYDQMAGTGFTVTRYASHSVLVFFVERSLSDEE